MLDIFAGEDGRCVFKSYTEKISNGKEILKHPLVTAVAVNTSDFDEFNVQSGLHIIISVKDFKAIVVHADTLKTSLKAYYSQPTRPLQFSYGCDGLLCEFTLMTSGDYSGAPATPAPAPQALSSRQTSRAPSHTTDGSTRSDMPPPTEPVSRRDRIGRLRNPGTRQNSELRRSRDAEETSNSLFIPDPDDAARQEAEDNAWAPLDHEREEDEMGWDATANNDASAFPTFRDSGSMSRTNTTDSNEVFDPTQRLSQVKDLGLW